MAERSLLDTEASKGHVDTNYEIMNRPQHHKFLGGGMHFTNNSDVERLYELNGMHRAAKQFRVS